MYIDLSMLRISLSPSELETFLSVAETGSFSRCAKLLGLSQPAVTARIQHFEQVIGVPLFHRTTRRVTLTEAGERLRIRVDHTMEELRGLLLEFDDEAHLRRGRISIGAAATISGEFLGSVITRFHIRQPQVEITLFDDFYGRALDRLSRGEVDLAVLPSEPEDDVFRFERLFPDPLVLAVASGHRLAGRGHVALAELVDETFVNVPPRSAGRDVFRREMESERPILRPTLNTRNPFAVLAIIKAGYGIGFLPRMLTGTLNLTGVVLLSLDDTDLSRDVGIVTQKGRALSPATVAFIGMLREAAAEHDR